MHVLLGGLTYACRVMQPLGTAGCVLWLQAPHLALGRAAHWVALGLLRRSPSVGQYGTTGALLGEPRVFGVCPLM